MSNAAEAGDTAEDVELSITVREKYLAELQDLVFKILNNKKVSPSRLVQLLEKIRFITLEIVEGIAAWQSKLKIKGPFHWNGSNYILKLLHDLDFLQDQCPSIPAFYGVSARRNPFLIPEAMEFKPRNTISELKGA